MILHNQFRRQVFAILIVLIGLAATSPLFSYTYSWDLQTYYPFAAAKLKSDEITPAIINRMNQIDANYSITQSTPSGVGISAKQMDELNDIAYGKYAISSGPDGQITGREIIIDTEDEYNTPTSDPDQPAGFNSDWLPDIIKIDTYYRKCSPSQTDQIQKIYQDMVQLWLDVECFPKSSKYHFPGKGYDWRNYGYKCLNMAHTLPDRIRQYLALSLFTYSGGSGLLSSADVPYSTTDQYHNVFRTMFRALAIMDDDAFKWQLLQTLVLQMDKTIIGTQGDNCLLTLDGGIIHHWGHHIHYGGYSFLDMVNAHLILADAHLTSPLTPQTVIRFRQTALSWAWADTNGNFSVHYNMRPSHPSRSISGGHQLGNTISFLKGAAELTAAVQYHDHTQIDNDLEMAYPAIAKAGPGSSALPSAWRAIKLPDLNDNPRDNWFLLNGHNTFQVNGCAFHRRNGWLASIRGAHNFRRGGEAYDEMGKPDHHHQQSMRGSLLLITEGLNGRGVNSADSGYFYEGWDHNYYPNVTNRVVELEKILYWRSKAYFSGAADLTGGANLFNNGVWFYVPTDNSQRKSAFFFDNRITLVTSDISFSDDGHNVITGLIQQGHTDFSQHPIVLDNITHAETGSWTLTAGGNHTLIDGNGNSYYIHPNSSTPPIKVQRSVQSWPYGLSQYYVGPGTMPKYIYQEDFIRDVNNGNIQPSTGNYSKAYFDHGLHPNGDTVAYTVLVQPTSGQFNTFVQNMTTAGSEPLTLDISSSRHLLYDVASRTWAAALFTSNQSLDQGGLLTANRPGAYMWQITPTTLRFSCGSSKMDDTSPFIVTFVGRWYKFKSYDTHFFTCSYDSTHHVTTVTLPYREFARQMIELTADDRVHTTANLSNFSQLAANWLRNCNFDCESFDLTGDGSINYQDLAHLAEIWLTQSSKPMVYTETFNNLPTTGWMNQTYTGDHGFQWTVNAKSTSNYLDSTKCIYMAAGMTGAQSALIPGGIRSLTVSCRNLWHIDVERTIQLLINQKPVAALSHLGTDRYTFSVDNISFPGNITIGLRNATPTAPGENRVIAIDNITWSSY